MGIVDWFTNDFINNFVKHYIAIGLECVSLLDF